MSPMPRQRGFSLIAAIFLIAVALLIVLAAAATLNARNRSTVQALEASRAFHAAQSGLDIAIARSIAGGCTAVPASLTIEGYSVTLSCSPSTADELPAAYIVNQLTALASKGNFSSSTFVSRRVRATVTQ